jgi:hypothetical protein
MVTDVGLEGLDLAAFQRLDRDLRQAALLLSAAEARYMVDLYYQIQDYRKRAANQTRALDESGEPHSLVRWVLANMTAQENGIRSALGKYSDGSLPGRWAKSIHGIGPVLSAGLLAHIDIEKAPTVGHIWRYAGLDPTVTWEKKTKRPWNARLKTLCWLVGESFVKVCNNDKDVYGHIYAERKTIEQARNEAGEYAEQAAAVLARKRIGQDTEAYGHYSAGHLPPAHIHSRAKRYSVKLFLSHLHHVMYESANGVPPPMPYILTKPEHAHYLAPPNWPMS